MSRNASVLHWSDFLCPSCYAGQSRTAILGRYGLDVVELPFQAHPDIPAKGVPVGPRTGEMYSHLEREAKKAGLVLNWPSRFLNTRHALAAAEWVWRHQPDKFARFQKALFAAHFVSGEDLGNTASIERHAAELGTDLAGFHCRLAGWDRCCRRERIGGARPPTRRTQHAPLAHRTALDFRAAAAK